MSSYSRMVVIPQEEYVQLSAMQQVRQPLANQIYRKELDYQQNLHVKDPYRATLLQSETVEELKSLKNKMRDSISSATPLSSRAHAIGLFNSIEPYLKVTERGEVISDDDKIIDSSRYEDLIQFATRRKRRQGFIPPGWSYFLSLLKKHNVPKFALNNETLKELASLSETPKVESPKVEMPKNWFKTSPSSIPVRQTRSRTTRHKSPPKKYMLSEY